jgi:small-conductance mechanosensitive channel
MRTVTLLAFVLALCDPVLAQQAPQATAPSPSPGAAAPQAGTAVAQLTTVAPPEQAAALLYGNRPILTMRGTLVGRTPQERAAAAVKRLDELVERRISGPISTEEVSGVSVVKVGGEQAFTILPTDPDPLAGETVQSVASGVERSLAVAMAEVVEARTPRLLLRAAGRSAAATLAALALGALLLWLRARAARRFAGFLQAQVVQQLERHAAGEFWRSAELRLAAVAAFLLRLLLLALELLLAYAWLTFVLRQFPYTRPWGEALRGFVVATVLRLADGMVAAIPGLFTVLLIVVITRAAGRVASAIFRAVEQGRLALPGVYPETAPPTRRIVIALLWVFAIVVAYPYLPGSGSDAFKGVSVFIGLMVSLGSSGLVNQAMSSFMIMYSRALRPGDFVRIGEIEGTVVHSGVLATKLVTRRNEEITLPNAVVAGSTITNYSRHAGDGVFVRTSVTIGYDTPWRQVEALLLEAASRTAGVRAEPRPRVLQTALADFYVEYTLLVAPERPEDRLAVLSTLHAHVQDAFNEHSVQIMSPNYEADPEQPKLVPRDRWFAAPAKPDRAE